MELVKKYLCPGGEEDGPGGRPDDRKPPKGDEPDAPQDPESDGLTDDDESEEDAEDPK